ncbi:unnamed protein product, partial [Symbiodinium natans]
AAALGDALERAEGQALSRVVAKCEDSDLAAELQQSRRKLADMTREAAAQKAELQQTTEGDSEAAAEIAAAVAALAESRADVEAAAAQEWRAAEAFDRLADLSKELEHVKAVAAADRSRHNEALAAAGADA